ncbi:unnamed protein product [Paramecium primaurelia]|uniref:Uncharacterized protein n=1 Tax=Paramecium primaurelia TaxID=5886 RepID=A0A8S1QF08_PARPR|nr:unnamed protein product [Paramecium primaurelia]
MLKDKKGIIDFIKFLVLITSIDSKFIQSGSNGLNILVGMKADIKNLSFENIRIKNTSLIGDISGLNLNGVQMFDCKWKNFKVHELNKLDVYTGTVYSVCFSPDGNTLAFGSGDNSILLQE